MMKPLFNDKAGYTQASRRLDLELNNLLTPVLEKWMEEGYSPRDIKYIADGVSLDITLGFLARNLKKK